MLMSIEKKERPESDIDFVIIWVDGNDPDWRAEREKYQKKRSDSDESRYRDWGILRYWFRTVELYAPWVRRIHFVTNGQKPEWLNLENRKINFVKHSDFIPSEYLPTFSSHTIELNLHRIPNLSEKFVYFNDDMYINRRVKPSDFFRGDTPCDSAILSTIKIERNGISSIILNNLKIINDRFDFRESVKKYPFKWFNLKYGKQLLRTFLLLPWHYFVGFYEMHIPYSYRKDIFVDIWNKEKLQLESTCRHKFRDDGDVNQWLIRYWILASGKFFPRSANVGKLYFVNETTLDVCDEIRNHKHKLFCISDSDSIIDFEKSRLEIQQAFEKEYPNKSEYER